MNNKIAIVSLYFGKLPNYFPLWLKSCSYNQSIDFYLFSDANVDVYPGNVHIVATTLEDVRQRASKVLGFEASLSRPYKCCDYKPLYGLIFSDYLSLYDYWGHCDIDLIFGDLSYFFNKYDLYDYDKFGTLGHLSLFKNNDIVNNAYKIQDSLQDYRDVFTTDKITVFDEICGISSMMIERGYKVFTKRVFVDISTRYKRYRIINLYPLDKPAVNYPYQSFYWKNGKTFHVYYENDEIKEIEYMYIHFQKRPNYEISADLLDSYSFYLTNHGFIPKEGATTIEQIKKLNPFKGRVYEIVENFLVDNKIRLKNKINRWRNR